MSDALVSLRGVSRSFRSAADRQLHILRDLDLDIAHGSFIVVRGVSGSGKTTLLRIIGMLDTDYTGSFRLGDVKVDGQPDWVLDELRAENIGFIFQEGRLFNHLSLQRNIEVPLILQGAAAVRADAAARVARLAPDFFERDEAASVLPKKPGPASGGQKQRASIMRAIINRPSLVLADEPTASLHPNLKQGVVDHLLKLVEQGHTVVVVSHDTVFYGHGRQLLLEDGVLVEQTAETPDDAAPPVSPAPDPSSAPAPAEAAPGEPDAALEPAPATDAIRVRRPSEASQILSGWRPRSPAGVLVRQALRETFYRPIFLFLILISLVVGVSQISVFSSVILGAQQYVNDQITKGSRLNRIEIKPRRADRSEEDRFPVREEIAALPFVGQTVERRAAIAQLTILDGRRIPFKVTGLHPDDPEYKLLTFAAGGPFTGEHVELEVIVTLALLNDLFDTSALADPEVGYDSFIGRQVPISLRQYTKSGDIRREVEVPLTVVGIILHAEGGRQLYLPNTTHLAFERFKIDRNARFELPVSESGTWSDPEMVREMAAFPWEDSLQVYITEIREVIPVYQTLSKMGYRPETDIWDFKWALDIQDTAWQIFLPLLVLILLAVAITVMANIFTSAKLRETELALWRVLGMRRGDMVLTQILSTCFSVLMGSVLGLMLGNGIVAQTKAMLAERGAEAAAASGGEVQEFDAIFAPVSEFYVPILAGAVVLGILAAVWPALNAARTDPAKVLQA